MEEKYANFLLQKNKEDYDRIAEEFSRKRSYLSGDILELKKYAAEGDKILDLGCGNGRLFELFKGMKVNYTGADVSENLLAAAERKYPAADSMGSPQAEFVKVDFLKLPFPDGSFDKVYCLSVFHHIPSRDFRLRFLAEIKRVLKPDGVLILTVWNFWGIFKIFKYAFLKIFARTGTDFKDIFVPFKDASGKILAERYHHCFTKRELKRLFSESGFETADLRVLKRGRYENFCLIGKPNG